MISSPSGGSGGSGGGGGGGPFLVPSGGLLRHSFYEGDPPVKESYLKRLQKSKSKGENLKLSL